MTRFGDQKRALRATRSTMIAAGQRTASATGIRRHRAPAAGADVVRSARRVRSRETAPSRRERQIRRDPALRSARHAASSASRKSAPRSFPCDIAHAAIAHAASAHPAETRTGCRIAHCAPPAPRFRADTDSAADTPQRAAADRARRAACALRRARTRQRSYIAR